MRQGADAGAVEAELAARAHGGGAVISIGSSGESGEDVGQREAT